MNEEVIKLYQRVEVPFTSLTAERVSPQAVQALNTAIAGMGYTLDRDLMAAVMRSSADDFRLFMTEMVGALATISGAAYDYPVLFAKFPYEVPEDRDYFLRRVVGMIQNHVGTTKQYNLVGCGHLVDPDLFDINEFGACPICQFQIPGIDCPENVIADYQRMTPLKLLGLADSAWLTETANGLLARQSSLSMDERLFLLSRIEQDDPPLTIPEKIFREQVPIAYLCAETNPLADDVTFGVWRTRNARKNTILTSATDVLRLAVLLSDPKGDLSLSKPVRFKLTTSQIKDLLRRLNGMDRLEEDMLRWKERWKALAKVLKPGTEKHRKNYPAVGLAFDRLMRRPKEIVTLNRVAERLLADGEVADYAMLLSQRPGEFLRKLDAMLRRTSTPSDILVPMVRTVTEAPTPLLFSLRKHLIHRAEGDPGDMRIFRPKGTNNRIMVVPDARPPIARNALVDATMLIERELVRRFSQRPPMGTVWIDPALDRIPLPANRRGDTSTSRLATKGMRWTLSPAAEVIRLFVWWKGDYDVDLSINLLGDDLRNVSHISYTRLSGDGCYHSGDIQNAPEGAAEFIDIPLDYTRRSGAAYVAMSVISYRGQLFNSFPCFAGYMERDAVKSGQRFEPESVALKFDVAMAASSAVPLIFDLENRQMVYADLSCGSAQHGGAYQDSDKFIALTSAVLDQPNRTTTAGDVIRVAAEAAGTIVEDRDAAGTVWDAETLDWNAVYALMD